MLVSIGLPFKNDAATLALAIRSVFAQSHEDWELILVDDGSSDRSPAVAASVKDQRVRLIHDGRSLGLPARLNQIAAAARAEYLFRMDADDVMHPERLTRQLEHLVAHPQEDIVATAAWSIDEAGTVYGLRGEAPLDLTARNYFRGALLIHPTVAAKTSFFRTFPYDPSFPKAQDRELWIRVRDRARIGHISAPLLFYRERGTFSLESYLATRRAERRLLRMYGDLCLGNVEARARIALSYGKTMIYGVADRLSLADRLVASRSTRHIAPDFAEEARAALQRVHRVAVPGLDDRSSLKSSAD